MRTTLSVSAALVGLLTACHGSDDIPPRTDDGTGETPGGALDPGRVVLHRLNRVEYDNTVQDLLGTTLSPAVDFPTDDRVAGYDNIASNLSISPLHVELYELAAQALADEVIAAPLSEALEFVAEGEGGAVTTTVGGASGDSWNLWSGGDLLATFSAPVDGTYLLSARVWASLAGPDLAQMSLGHDGFVDLTSDVTATSSGDAQTFEFEVELLAGPHTVVVSFLNDFYDPDAGLDRNLFVDWVGASGPTDVAPGPNGMRDRWVTCDPVVIGDAACAEVALRALAAKAWRRPTTEDEVARLMGVVTFILDDGGTFDEALKWGIVSVLVSPHFIYRVEIDPSPTTGVANPLTSWELASRLSYFLWSSMPDDALFAAAERGELATDEQIAAEVTRMLADPRAQALVDNFGGQWLFIRGMDDITKDPATYPLDDVLRASMKEEMNRFFESFVFGQRDMRELLTATDGEIDAILADHYGLPFSGTGWQSVDLSAAERGGLLGQAGMLTVNSYPTRTSPVIRGKYVLGQLLCSEPPPPPPGVEGFDEEVSAQTVREQLEQHRADPVCASCHDAMDNIGFGLENFDALGAWRDQDRGFPVDASGVMPNGPSFVGAIELSAILGEDPRFTSCMVEQAFTYGLGRIPSIDDGPFIAEIDGAFAAGGYTFESLAIAITTSDPFRMRRGEP